jgi:hypothetical protein
MGRFLKGGYMDGWMGMGNELMKWDYEGIQDGMGLDMSKLVVKNVKFYGNGICSFDFVLLRFI